MHVVISSQTKAAPKTLCISGTAQLFAASTAERTWGEQFQFGCAPQLLSHEICSQSKVFSAQLLERVKKKEVVQFRYFLMFFRLTSEFGSASCAWKVEYTLQKHCWSSCKEHRAHSRSIAVVIPAAPPWFQHLPDFNTTLISTGLCQLKAYIQWLPHCSGDSVFCPGKLQNAVCNFAFLS